MTDRLTIEVTGDITATLAAAIARLEHPKPLMQLVGATLQANVGQRFVSKTDPAGAPWAPLAPQTIARKQGQGSLLELSGRGVQSLGYVAGDDFVEVGFGEAYMGFHETGTRKMPRRGMLLGDAVAGTLGQADEEDIAADVLEYLQDLGF